MRGRGVEFGATWADVGNAVGYTEDLDEESLLDFLHVVLLEDVPSIVLEPLPEKPTPNSKERQTEDAKWNTLSLLTLAGEPLTLSGLAAMQHKGIPIVREAVAMLEALGLVAFAKKSRLVFRKSLR